MSQVMGQETPGTNLANYTLLRHRFLRVSTQAQNRLTVSGVLAGLVCGLCRSSRNRSQHRVNQLPKNFDLTQWSGLFLTLGGVLLGFTSILFLLAVVCTYAVVDVFGDIAPKTIKELNDAPATGPSINPHDLTAIEASTIPSIDTDDVWRIDKASSYTNDRLACSRSASY